METPTPPNPFVADDGNLAIPSFEEWFFLPALALGPLAEGLS